EGGLDRGPGALKDPEGVGGHEVDLGATSRGWVTIHLVRHSISLENVGEPVPRGRRPVGNVHAGAKLDLECGVNTPNETQDGSDLFLHLILLEEEVGILVVLPGLKNGLAGAISGLKPKRSKKPERQLHLISLHAL